MKLLSTSRRDLGQKVASLRLGRPRLQPTDVSESDICVDLVAVRYEEAGNLAEMIELRSRRVDVDETGIVGLWRPMQNLERRETSIPFDDGVFLVCAIPHNDQRLVLKEAVVQIGPRKLLQHPLLAEISQNLRLRLLADSFREPRILGVEKQLVEGNPLNGPFSRVCFIH